MKEKKNRIIYIYIFIQFILKQIITLTINHILGDWGLGIGDWGLGPIPNPQSPIPNPQSPLNTIFNNKTYVN